MRILGAAWIAVMLAISSHPYAVASESSVVMLNFWSDSYHAKCDEDGKRVWVVKKGPDFSSDSVLMILKYDDLASYHSGLNADGVRITTFVLGHDQGTEIVFGFDEYGLGQDVLRCVSGD